MLSINNITYIFKILILLKALHVQIVLEDQFMSIFSEKRYVLVIDSSYPNENMKE